MTRIAIYARVSTAGQEERHTIESQLVACRAYCAAQGYEVAAEFLDDGVSGAVPFDERPEAARLLVLAQEGLFTRVVIYTVDRLGRDTSEGIIAVRLLRKAKAVPEFVSQSFDDTAEGRFTFQVFLAVAELERGLIARRTTQGRRRKAEGGYIASITPFGYTSVRATKTAPPAVVVNEAQAGVVREIFRLAVEEDLGLHAIAALLNKRGTPPPDNAGHAAHLSTHGWHPSTVARILRAPRYAGMPTYAGGAMTCPPLITRELFDAASDGLTRRRRSASSHPKRVYLLRTLARCRQCGSYCTGVAAGQALSQYYVCNTARRYGAKRHGGKAQWSARLVEPVVQRWALALLNDPDAALAQADLFFHGQDAAAEERAGEKRLIDAKLKALSNEEENAVTLQVKGRIDEPTMLKQLDRIRSERDGALGRLSALEQADTQAARQAVDAHLVRAAIDLMRATPLSPEQQTEYDLVGDILVSHGSLHQWQGTISSLVSCVWLEPDGSVTVEGLLPTALPEAAQLSPPS